MIHYIPRNRRVNHSNVFNHIGKRIALNINKNAEIFERYTAYDQSIDMYKDILIYDSLYPHELTRMYKQNSQKEVLNTIEQYCEHNIDMNGYGMYVIYD